MAMMVLEIRAIGPEIARPIPQVVMQKRMCRERRGRRKQQLVIVMRADERIDGDNTLAARPVLDYHRLAPSLREPVGQQTRTDIGAAARAEVRMNFTGRVG